VRGQDYTRESHRTLGGSKRARITFKRRQEGYVFSGKKSAKPFRPQGREGDQLNGRYEPKSDLEEKKKRFLERKGPRSKKGKGWDNQMKLLWRGKCREGSKELALRPTDVKPVRNPQKKRKKRSNEKGVKGNYARTHLDPSRRGRGNAELSLKVQIPEVNAKKGSA